MTRSKNSWPTRRRWAFRTAALAGVGGIVWLAAPFVAIHRAESALNRHDAKSAIVWLDRAGFYGHQQGRIEFLRARSLRRLGRLDEFRAALLVAAAHGYSVDALDREQVLLLVQTGQLSDVEHRMSDILQTAGDDAGEACEAYASGLLVNLRQTEALNVVTHWARDYPHDPQPELVRGLIYKDLNRKQHAIDAFHKALDLDPECVACLRELGTMLLEMRQLDEALSIFEKLSSDESSHDDAMLSISKCHRQRGALDAAEQALAQISRDSTQPGDKVLLQTGLLCLDRHKYDEALAALSQVLTSQPRLIEARHGRAQALRNLGRFDEAAQESRKVAEAESELSRIRQLEDAVAADPEEIAARYEIGRIELVFGNEQRGVIWLQSVLRLEPDDLESIRLLADYYASHINHAGFAKLAKKYRALAESLTEPAAAGSTIP